MFYYFENKYPISTHIYIALVLILCLLSTSAVLGYVYNATYVSSLMCIACLPLFAKRTKAFKPFDKTVILVLFVTLLQLFLYNHTFLYWCQLILWYLCLTRFSIYLINMKYPIWGAFYNIFFVISAISFVIYLCVEFLHISIPHTQVAIDWLPPYNLYLGIYVQRLTDMASESFFNISFSRNHGLFTEPGLHALFLCLILFIDTFLKKKKNLLSTLLVLIMLISTYSTTGIIVASLIFAYYFYSKSKGGLSVLLAIGIGIVLVTYFNILMLEKQEAHAFSYAARSYDLIGGFELFLRSPLWGWGFKNHEIFYDAESALFDDRGNSNGIVSMLYQLGLIGAAIFILPFRNFYKIISIKEHKHIYILFLLILILLVMGEPIQYAPAGFLILSYFTAISHYNLLQQNSGVYL